MEREDRILEAVDLATASEATEGGPTGYIEVAGFLPKQGIEEE